ncbi:uncharacterized protein LOC128963981 [Oppia nitens]|uniref:uncharacterized protein LOC128963981 n=1 Tax=Oppia nitens TaxID=1686743 RepID=UPI0023DADADA|nr:uncharacterized protein LOC128963981 [Oppia nitens]
MWDNMLDLNIINIFLIAIVCQQFIICIAQQNSLLANNEDQSVATKQLWTKQLTDSSIGVIGDPLPSLDSSHKSSSPVIQAKHISCYECNSFIDPDCIIHPEKFERNCTNGFGGSNFVGCRKIDQWVDYDDGPELKKHHRVIRQCAADGDISKPCYYRAGYGGRTNACFCDTDLCNSGQMSTPFTTFLSVLLSLSLLLTRKVIT